MEGPGESTCDTALTLCWQLQLHRTGRDGAGVVPSRWAGQLCHQPRGQQHGLEREWPETAQPQQQPLQTWDGEKLPGTSPEA